MSKVPNRTSGRTPVGVTALVLFARFISGRDLDGIRRTNATFLRHADADLTNHQRATRWAHRRHAERAGIRLAATVITLAIAWGMLFHRLATELSVVIVSAVTLTVISIRVTRKAVTAKHHFRVTNPMYRTVARHVGLPPGDVPSHHLVIPRDYRTNPKASVRMNVGSHWTGTPGERRLVTQIMTNRLGHGDWTAHFDQSTHMPYVEFRKMPQPPSRVILADFIRQIDAAKPGELVWGMGASDRVIVSNLDSDAPHIALSMGTGGGKSDTVASVIAQLVRKGECERIDVIDPKRVSHNWARGLPGVYIHRYVAGQMTAISNARIAMDHRYEQMELNPDIVFLRRVLIIEEQNSLMQDLADYWEDYRRELPSVERGKTPRINPAIADLNYVLNKGRQCRMNVISIYQRMSAKASGGGDARENYGCKILSRYSTQTWKMLVDISPMPRPSRVPGRGVFVLGDEYLAVQRVYAGIAKPDGSADREGIARLRAFALNGAEDASQTDTPDPRPDGTAGLPVPALSVVRGSEAVIAEAELITLREAADTGVIPLRLSALRKARQRDSEFPAGVASSGGTLYRPAELQAWQANRVRARQAA
jgi:hypothetical protein